MEVSIFLLFFECMLVCFFFNQLELQKVKQRRLEREREREERDKELVGLFLISFANT